jgi:hypothetical protein
MSDVLSPRGLFNAMLDYQGTDVYTELLAPWVDANVEVRDWLHAFAQRPGSPIPDADNDDLYELYALSRICDLLLLGLPGGDMGEREWRAPSISPHDFQAFFESLGMATTWPQNYSPFHHEIAGLVSSEDVHQEPKVLEFVWPCLMLGPMLFMRAGVHVSAGSQVLAPGIADTSTIYWAYFRKSRPTSDLSKGWGSNSQWRTHFRRDYQIGSSFYFNVDGSLDLSPPRVQPGEADGLSRAEAIEILVNRHFVTARLPDDDLFPYNFRFSIGVPVVDEPRERSAFPPIRNVLQFALLFVAVLLAVSSAQLERFH